MNEYFNNSVQVWHHRDGDWPQSSGKGPNPGDFSIPRGAGYVKKNTDPSDGRISIRPSEGSVFW